MRLLREWLRHGEPRPLPEEPGFLTVPGVFNWETVDPGSRLLAEHLPAGLAGRVADLGAGTGFLGRWILGERPHVTALHLYEADAVALGLARENLATAGRGGATVAFEWHDVTRGLGFAEFDAVVMNPPFHAGREADPQLGLRFMASGVGALRPGGQLWVVANRFLPYERFLASALPNFRVLVQEKGFKVLTGSRSKTDEPAVPVDSPPWRRPHRKRLMRRGSG
jgi:16S rRNA (guanine1207-N2)-methyltransferase